MKYATIKAGSDIIEVHEVEEITLERLQDVVGGWIEAITVGPTKSLPALTMYLNEDGKGLGLPLNQMATIMAKRHLLPGDYIAGNVLLCGLPDDEGNDTTFPESWIEAIAKVAI